jgi:hypothetical protein
MTMKDLSSETGEMNDEDLKTVTGGSVVDTVVGVARNVWNILTRPLPGVKGEAMDKGHRDSIE